MRVLVLNCGSSSLKYRLVDVGRAAALDGGLIERVGEAEVPDHATALATALDAVDHRGLTAVAHRVVHGGARFSAPVVVDDDVLAEIRALAVLAPVHNAVNALGIELARRAVPAVPHVAVFDTAFHHTLPPRAYTYAVPLDWAREHGVRRYGFHGTSVAYVARAAARLLDRPLEQLDLIVLHLGNGASATALAGGRSVDTSMGLTPLEGLVMGARSGDVDPALVLHLRRTAELSVEQIDHALNERSGMLALAGDNDVRRLLAREDDAAALALDVYCYRIRKYVGAYLAVLGGADAIVFTGGVGEHAAPVRARALNGLERLGIALDADANAASAPTISSPGAAIRVLVIPTDEELELATQAAALVRTATPSS